MNASKLTMVLLTTALFFQPAAGDTFADGLPQLPWGADDNNIAEKFGIAEDQIEVKKPEQLNLPWIKQYTFMQDSLEWRLYFGSKGFYHFKITHSQKLRSTIRDSKLKKLRKHWQEQVDTRIAATVPDDVKVYAETTWMRVRVNGKSSSVTIDFAINVINTKLRDLAISAAKQREQEFISETIEDSFGLILQATGSTDGQKQ